MRARDELRHEERNSRYEWDLKFRHTSHNAPGFYNETQLARKAVESVPETFEEQKDGLVEVF
jgi:hypothetical protein